MIPDVASTKSSDVVDSIVCVVEDILVISVEEMLSNTAKERFSSS